MFLITRRLASAFSKWSKPKPKTKEREFAKSFAVGDEKAAKLSKSEQEQENKNKALEAEKIVKETMYSLIYLVARLSSCGRMMPRSKSSKARQNWKTSSIIRIFISPPPPNASRTSPNRRRLRSKLWRISSICPLSSPSSRQRTTNIGSSSPSTATTRSRSTLGSPLLKSSEAARA